MQNERWKPVLDFEEKYEISNYCRIRHKRKGNILKPRQDKYGYWQVQLSIDHFKKKNKGVHRLVMEAFFPREDCRELEVNHKDGNKQNNSLSNLEWVTRTENERHARKMGLTMQSGHYSIMASLNFDQVREIRRLRLRGATLKSLAEQFNIAIGTACDICNRKTYKNIE